MGILGPVAPLITACATLVLVILIVAVLERDSAREQMAVWKIVMKTVVAALKYIFTNNKTFRV